MHFHFTICQFHTFGGVSQRRPGWAQAEHRLSVEQRPTDKKSCLPSRPTTWGSTHGKSVSLTQTKLLRPYPQFLVGTYLIEYYSASIFTRAHNKSNWVTHVKAIMEDCFSNLKLDRFTPIRTETGGLDDTGESKATNQDWSWSFWESGQ